MNSTDISPKVHIGEVVRNAVLFKPRNPQEQLMSSDFLIETVARFFSLLRKRQIEYVLVGGIAFAPIRGRTQHGSHRSDYGRVRAGAVT